VVEADRRGEGEEACADAGCESVEGAGSVAFEGEPLTRRRWRCRQPLRLRHQRQRQHQRLL